MAVPFTWHTAPITADQALEARAKAALEKPIAEHGGDRKSQESTENQGNNVTLNSARGNSQEYLLRHIARDRPELLEQIGKDKPYKSARAVRKPRSVLSLTIYLLSLNGRQGRGGLKLRGGRKLRKN